MLRLWQRSILRQGLLAQADVRAYAMPSTRVPSFKAYKPGTENQEGG